MAEQTYAVLVRGINVGGKNKVDMTTLRGQLTELGFDRVRTYINSGNIFITSSQPRTTIVTSLKDFLTEHYPFITSFSLLSQTDYLAEYATLPAWWQENLARKDVLFFTEDMDKEAVIERIKTYPLHDEIVYFGQLGIYWGKYSETEYLKTSYHKKLMKEDFYRQITIRNGKTAAKIADFLSDEESFS